MALEQWLAQNWSEVREQRGLTWAELAQQCRTAGHDDVAAWAEEKAKAEPSARAKKTTGRAVAPPREKRG